MQSRRKDSHTPKASWIHGSYKMLYINKSTQQLNQMILPKKIDVWLMHWAFEGHQLVHENSGRSKQNKESEPIHCYNCRILQICLGARRIGGSCRSVCHFDSVLEKQVKRPCNGIYVRSGQSLFFWL